MEYFPFQPSLCSSTLSQLQLSDSHISIPSGKFTPLNSPSSLDSWWSYHDTYTKFIRRTQKRFFLSFRQTNMKVLFGSPGKISGLLLRIGQCSFAAAAIGVMVSAHGFYTSTAFCYLIASMGLEFLWSLGLACLDFHALRSKRSLQNPALLSLFVVGDWVTATLSLAGACSSAGVTVLLSDLDSCNNSFPCTMFQIGVAFAFISWFLLAVSSLVMFWLLGAV